MSSIPVSYLMFTFPYLWQSEQQNETEKLFKRILNLHLWVCTGVVHGLGFLALEEILEKSVRTN